ncbi:MAG: sarcosine oxidase subunit gamma family protein [Gordonia sp. (in: high G+C Gram-positive bacteria)]
MAEHAEYRSPLHHWQERFAALAPAVELCESPVAQTIVRTEDPAAIAALDLPGVCERRTTGDETALWLGPTEWLLYQPGITGHTYAARVAERVTASGSGSGTYVLDATGQRTRLLLSGPHAETVVRHGCAKDLDPTAFGAREVVQTLLAQAAIVLHRSAVGEGYVLLVRSSFADYLAAWLVDAATEYTHS